LVLSASTLFGCGKKDVDTTQYPKREVVEHRWLITDVRASNLLVAESSGSHGVNTGAGAVVGGGIGYLAGASPLGIAAAAVTGAAAGSVIPVSQISLSMSTCAMFAQDAEGKTTSFIYNTKEDPVACGECLLARPGDVITVTTFKSWFDKDTEYPYVSSTLTIGPGPLEEAAATK
jgi:hypothetical protein